MNECGDVYVTDIGQDRIMCWPSGCGEGCVIVGGNGEGRKSNQFRYLRGLSLDVENNLYAVDCGNHRIQRFSLDQN